MTTETTDNTADKTAATPNDPTSAMDIATAIIANEGFDYDDVWYGQRNTGEGFDRQYPQIASKVNYAVRDYIWRMDTDHLGLLVARTSSTTFHYGLRAIPGKVELRNGKEYLEVAAKVAIIGAMLQIL